MLIFPFSKARNWDLEMQTDFTKITKGSGITTKVPFLYCRMVSSDTLPHFFHLEKKKKNHLRTQNLAIPVLYTFNTERSFPRWQTAGRSRWLGGKEMFQPGALKDRWVTVPHAQGSTGSRSFQEVVPSSGLGFASVKQHRPQTQRSELLLAWNVVSNWKWTWFSSKTLRNII